jgi:hypothetical protein
MNCGGNKQNMEDQTQPVEIVGNDALTAISRAEIDMQIATAKRYPRNLMRVKTQMLSIATMDQETAEACFYSLPRGGKNIEGPSVRMAEIALSAYGNVKAGTRILSVHTGENPHAVVQAVVLDLENNVGYSVEKRRRIVGKKKNDGRPDEDDINLAVNAGSAIAFRDAVFKVVPGALVKSVFDAAKKVAVGDLKSLSATRARIIERLQKYGATTDRILAKLGLQKVEEINLEHVEILMGLGTALKDGHASLEEAFPPLTPTGTATATTAFRKTKPDPTPTQPPADPPPQDPAVLATPQAELASIVSGAGYSIDQFNKWAVAEGLLTAEVGSFDDVPLAVAVKLVRAKTGMLTGIQNEGGAR